MQVIFKRNKPNFCISFELNISVLNTLFYSLKQTVDAFNPVKNWDGHDLILPGKLICRFSISADRNFCKTSLEDEEILFCC